MLLLLIGVNDKIKIKRFCVLRVSSFLTCAYSSFYNALMSVSELAQAQPSKSRNGRAILPFLGPSVL